MNTLLLPSRSVTSTLTFVFAVAGCTALSAVAQTTAPSAPQAAPETPQTQPAEQAAAMPDLKPIMSALEEIRGLEFTSPVPARRQSVEAWSQYIDSQLEAYFPADRQEGMQQGLMRLGLLMEPMDVGQELKSALLGQAAAYYNPEQKTFFYLMDDMPAMMLQTVAAHELVHALQDQHADLERRMDELEKAFTEDVRHEDRMLAFRFLVEGEATYVHTIWQVKSMTGMDLSADPNMEAMQMKMMADLEVDQVVAMTQQMQGQMGMEMGEAINDAIAQMDEIPSYVLHPLYAAYLRGAYFTMSLRHEGGWEAVDRAYESMPLSAEQTMHPEKYGADRDDPTPVSLPDLPMLAAGGWRSIDAAVLGEFYLRLLLRNFDCPKGQATVATEGWDGDMYRAFRHDDGQVLVVMATTWDSEADASEYFEAYRSILGPCPQPENDAPAGCKYPKLTVQGTASDAEVVFDCCDETQGFGRLVRRGREVFAVEGGSDELNAAVMAELAKLRVEHVK